MNNSKDLSPLQVTITKAADMLGITYAVLWPKVRSGHVESVSENLRIRIPVSEVERYRLFLSEQRQKLENDYTIEDAAYVMGYCVTIIRRMVADKSLESYRIGRHIRITRVAIEKWQSENRNG